MVNVAYICVCGACNFFFLDAVQACVFKLDFPFIFFLCILSVQS